MADTVYTYSIQNGFPNHAINPSRLTTEIASSAIVTALDAISTLGDVASVAFKAALSTGDKTTLDALVAAHSGLPLPNLALPIAIDTNNASVLFNQNLTTSGSSVAYGNYASKSIALLVNVKNAPTGTSPSVQFTMSEVDPGDGVTLVGSTVTGAAITAAGTQVLTLPSTVSGSVLVSWTVTGTTPSFTGVFATIVSKSSFARTDIFGNPIVQLAPQAAGLGLLPGVTAGRADGYVATSAASAVAVRATTYTPQASQAQRSVSSTSASDTSAGTGAQKVTINYLTSAGVLKSETVTLNGTTPVNTVGTDIQFVDGKSVSQVGSGGKNAGTIQLFTATAGGGSVFASIAAGDNRTYWAHHYVPPGVTCYVLRVQAGASAQSGTIECTHTGNPSVANLPTLGVGGKFAHGGGADSRSETLEVPAVVPGPDLIVLTDTPNSTTVSKTTGSFEYIQF